MSQYPGAQPPPPQDPYYGQPPAEPYGAPPPQPSDPYLGSQPQDPYAPPQDPWYGQQPPDAQAQQQAWYAQTQQQAAQQQAAQAQRQAYEASQARGGSGAAIFGLLLVLVGAWILFGDQLDIDLEWGEVWPVGAVVIGSLMVLASVLPRRGRER